MRVLFFETESIVIDKRTSSMSTPISRRKRSPRSPLPKPILYQNQPSYLFFSVEKYEFSRQNYLSKYDVVGYCCSHTQKKVKPIWTQFNNNNTKNRYTLHDKKNDNAIAI